MINEIIPAILPKSFEDLKNHLETLRGVATFVQIDLCDGVFVKSRTWPFNDADAQSIEDILEEREGMPYWQEFDFELDLMVSDAVTNFENYMRLGPKRIVFHVEAFPSIAELGDFIEGLDISVREYTEIGIAINIQTNVETIFPLVNFVDFVQCMGIETIGQQGQEFDESVLTQIKALHEKFPELSISVDGGVDMETIPMLKFVGATRFVCGSAIFKSENPHIAIEELESLV